MSLFKAYLFDLDGTLVDTAKAYEQILYELEWINQPLDNKAKYISGVDVRGLMDYLFGHEIGDTTERTKVFLDYYDTHLERITIFYPGALALLEKLKKHHLIVGIVSNRYHIYCQKLSRIFDLKLDIFMGSGIIPYLKPHPAPLIYAAKKLNLHPKDCFYLGDMPTDLRAAHLALMHAAYASYGCYSYFDKNFHYRQQIDQLSQIEEYFLHQHT